MAIDPLALLGTRREGAAVAWEALLRLLPAFGSTRHGGSVGLEVAGQVAALRFLICWRKMLELETLGGDPAVPTAKKRLGSKFGAVPTFGPVTEALLS